MNGVARLVNTENSRLSYMEDSTQVADQPLERGSHSYFVKSFSDPWTTVLAPFSDMAQCMRSHSVLASRNGIPDQWDDQYRLEWRASESPSLGTVQELQVSTLNNSAELGSNFPITV